MEDRHDDVPPTLEDLQWEEDRAATLRTFEVVLRDGTAGAFHPVAVVAHFWDTNNPAGHWNFYTIQPSGRTLIQSAFGSADVIKVRETTPHAVAIDIDQIAKRKQALLAGRQVMDSLKRPSRRTH